MALLPKRGRDDDHDATSRQNSEDRSRAGADPNPFAIPQGFTPDPLPIRDTFPAEWTGPQAGESASVEVPDLIGEVIGFRMFDCFTGAAGMELHTRAMPGVDRSFHDTQFRSKKFNTDVSQHRLVSPFQQYTWEKGTDTARRMGKDEGGFYAYHDLSRIGSALKFQGSTWKIPTVIQAWGEIYVYESGFRAQHVRLVLLAFCENWAWRDVQNYRKWARDTYDCGICPEDELERASRKFGEPVALHLRPKN